MRLMGWQNISADLYSQWKTLALGGDNHIEAVYNSSNSWTLGYNVFADVWLGTEVVEPSVRKHIGLPFTSRLIIPQIYNSHSAFINNITLDKLYPNQTLFDIPLADNVIPPITISGW